MKVKRDEVLRFLNAINYWECNKYFDYTNDLVDLWNRAMIVKKEKEIEGFHYTEFKDSIAVPNYLYYMRDFDAVCKLLDMTPTLIVMYCKSIVMGITEAFYIDDYNKFIGLLKNQTNDFMDREELLDIICKYPEEFEEILKSHCLIAE